MRVRDLKDFSDEQLQVEIERRTKEKAKQTIPNSLPNPNWGRLINYVTDICQCVANGEGKPKDFEHWVFELVMETIYGPTFWKWWNKQF